MESFRKHRDFIDQEVNAIDILEAKAWRSKQLEGSQQQHAELSETLERVEQEKLAREFRVAMAWLGANEEQKDTLAKLLRTSESRNSHWSLTTPAVLAWIEQGGENVFLWLTGIPGAGECQSTLTTSDVELLECGAEPISVALFYCTIFLC